MNYQVLARRYRPRRFEEVVGQESVAATLRGAIVQERTAHAYLFTGPRGVGKTSMARIFAKALNCPRAGDRTADRESWGRPCTECPACEAIHLGQDINVVELDGASHRGIEDIRGIIEGVSRPAAKSPFKIYIIDEVHMLTREAFNALLKTLEEPPPHVKFVFATTEPHRIPETVLSRCQRFDFHPIGDDAIVLRLSQILGSESRRAEDGLLEKVARYGKGGLRDAQTLLDQLMTFSDGDLKLEDLDRITGRVPAAAVERLAAAAVGADPAGVLREIRACFERGADPSVLLEQMVEGLRSRIHGVVAGEAGAVDAASLDRLIGSLQILLETAARLKHSPFAEITVEVALLKLSRLEDPAALEDVLRSLAEIETRGGRVAPPAPPRAEVPRPEAARPEAPRAEPPRPEAARPEGLSAPDFRHLRSVWDQIRIELEGKYPDIAPYFQDIEPVPCREAPGSFLVEFTSEFYYRQMKSARKQEAFLAVVRDVTGAAWNVRTAVAASPAGPAGGPPGLPGPPTSAGPPVEASSAPPGPPVRVTGEGVVGSPIVKKSIDLFNGRIV